MMRARRNGLSEKRAGDSEERHVLRGFPAIDAVGEDAHHFAALEAFPHAQHRLGMAERRSRCRAWSCRSPASRSRRPALSSRCITMLIASRRSTLPTTPSISKLPRCEPSSRQPRPAAIASSNARSLITSTTRSPVTAVQQEHAVEQRRREHEQVAEACRARWPAGRSARVRNSREALRARGAVARKYALIGTSSTRQRGRPACSASQMMKRFRPVSAALGPIAPGRAHGRGVPRNGAQKSPLAARDHRCPAPRSRTRAALRTTARPSCSRASMANGSPGRSGR